MDSQYHINFDTILNLVYDQREFKPERFQDTSIGSCKPWAKAGEACVDASNKCQSCVDIIEYLSNAFDMNSNPLACVLARLT